MITFIPRKQLQSFEKLEQLQVKYVFIIVRSEKENLGQSNDTKFVQRKMLSPL